MSVTSITGGKKVTASCATTGATLHYTDDGSTPTADSTEFPAGGLSYTVVTDKTVKVIAVKDGWSDSVVASKAVTVAKLEAPVVTAGTNAFTMTGPTGATLHYTIDGSAPTADSTTYTAEVAITETVTVKAIAVKNGNATSAVATQEVTYTAP